MSMKEQLYKAVMSHAQGNIDKAVANIGVYMNNAAGIGEHPDIEEEKVKQLKIVDEKKDEKDKLEKHFGSDRVKLDG